MLCSRLVHLNFMTLLAKTTASHAVDNDLWLTMGFVLHHCPTAGSCPDDLVARKLNFKAVQYVLQYPRRRIHCISTRVDFQLP